MLAYCSHELIETLCVFSIQLGSLILASAVSFLTAKP